MPINTHLQRLDITDFTAGLWDIKGANNLLAPQNAFVVLDDYVPIKGGGLRAFFKGDTMVTTGITSPGTKMPTGFYARGGVAPRSGSGSDADDLLLPVIDNVTGKSQIYRMDGSNLETVWKSAYINAAGGTFGGEHTEFAMFRTTTLDFDYLFVLRSGGDQGLFKMAYVGGAGPPAADGVVTKLQAYTGALLTSQARILIGDSGDIVYSDVGDDIWTSTVLQRVTVAPNDPRGRVAMLSDIDPSDLLVGLHGAPWYQINGDISSASTPVRAMGDDHHQLIHYQHPCRVPNGLAFIESGRRIFITDGRNFQSISDAIAPFAADIGSQTGPGQLAFSDDYLFAPGGKIYDFRTGAWLRSTLMTSAAFFCTNQAFKVYMTNAVAGVAVAVNRTADDAVTQRVSSGLFQTVPYRDERGRSVRIREVQILAQCYASSTFVVSIIDSTGATVSTDTVTGVTGRGVTSFLFPHTQDEYLSVKVAPSAENGTSEAPTIECVSIFFGANNLIGNAPE